MHKSRASKLSTFILFPANCIYRNVPYFLHTVFTGMYHTSCTLYLQECTILPAHCIYRNVPYFLHTAFTGMYHTSFKVDAGDCMAVCDVPNGYSCDAKPPLLYAKSWHVQGQLYLHQCYLNLAVLTA